MSKLTKAQAKLHQQACDLIATNKPLTWDERWFVVEHWQESANHVNSSAGAFFTPSGLASDFALEACGRTVIDLCAGIGALSLAILSRAMWESEKSRITCIEKNPDYIEVGRKVLPEASWFECDVFDALDVGFDDEPFEVAIGNPPFGSTPRHGRNGPRFTGQEFEYHVIDIAAKLSRRGAFIIPQNSAPFRLSGQRHYERVESDRYKAFHAKTGITLAAGIGIDCAYYEKEWKGASPKVEIVTFDLDAEYDDPVKAEPPKPKPEKPMEAQDRQDDLFAREVAA